MARRVCVGPSALFGLNDRTSVAGEPSQSAGRRALGPTVGRHRMTPQVVEIERSLAARGPSTLIPVSSPASRRARVFRQLGANAESV